MGNEFRGPASHVFSGRVTLPASVAGASSFNIPHGTAPSSPVNGDAWTTSAGMYVRINGTTIGPLSGPWIKPTGAAVIGLTIEGYASQTADLQQWQADGGSVLARMTKDGNAYLGNRLWLGDAGGTPSSYNGPAAAGAGLTADSVGNWRLWAHNGTSAALALSGSNTGTVAIWGAANMLAGIQGNDGFGGNQTFKVTAAGVTTISPDTDAVSLSVERGTDSFPTANIQEWLTAAGTALTAITKDGYLAVGNGGVAAFHASSNSSAGKQPVAEIYKDISAGGHAVLTIRGAIGSGAVERVVGIMFKMSSEADTTESNKSWSLTSYAAGAWASSPSFVIRSGALNKNSMLIDGASGVITLDGDVVAGTSGSTSGVTITNTGSNGANLKLAGNGGSTPNKYIRAQGGELEVVNSSYGGLILAVSDTGVLRGYDVWKPVAGTTTKAPLQYTAGSLLTSVADGAQEYTGKAYFSTLGTTQGRALDVKDYLVITGADQTIASPATAFGVLPAASDTITLAAATTYQFEVFCHIQSTGTTSNGLRFGISGSATWLDTYYMVHVDQNATSATTMLNSATYGGWVGGVTGQQAISSAVATATYRTVRITGTLRVNASGTFSPQFQFSAAPGGTTTILAGATVRVRPVGAATDNTADVVGAWS